MGLQATIQSSVVSAFVAMGDLAKPATLKSLTGVMVRDLDAGTSVAQSVDHAIQGGVFVRFKDNENDSNIILETDAKFICPRLWIADLAVPKAADLIVDALGGTWEIIRNMSDPAEAAFIAQVRRKK